ncbi:MAG: hypothetical protein RLZ44_621 [Pseudomonadota bacterium]|jgi:hypothetical protein
MSYDDDDWNRPRRGIKRGTTLNRNTSKRKAYVAARIQGFSPMQSAKRAGYADPKGEAERLEAHPEVQSALSQVRSDKKLEKQAVYTREKVFQLIEEGLEMSKATSDPMAFFKGVQEINKMQGFYAAEKHELGISPELAALQGNLAALTEAQLLEKLGEEKGITIDVDAEVLSVRRE